MKRLVLSAISLSAVLAAAGCGDGDTPDDGGAGGGGDDGGGTSQGGSSSDGGGAQGGNGEGASDAEWQTVMTAEWSLDPFSEKTSDTHFLTLDRDIYVGGIRPIAPLGTHHTVVALDNLDFNHIIYASGVNTNEIMFPEGVGLKMLAGQVLVLQLHLFNTSGEVLTGTSGIEIIEIAPEDVEAEADLYLPGPSDFAIPPLEEYTYSGTCTVDAQQNIFAIFPHMHQYGRSFKATANIGGEEVVLHDDLYDFNHQAFIPFETLTLNPGDSITTECTWLNPEATPPSVGWGESSTQEMCFSILYRYPRQESNSFCDDAQ